MLADLVAALGEPSESYDIGAPVSSRLEIRRKTAFWCLQSRLPRTQPLDEHIEELVAFVEAHSGFAALGDQIEGDIFCGVFTGDGTQGGFTLTSDLTRRLGELGLDVTFDLH